MENVHSGEKAVLGKAQNPCDRSMVFRENGSGAAVKTLFSSSVLHKHLEFRAGMPLSGLFANPGPAVFDSVCWLGPCPLN